MDVYLEIAAEINKQISLILGAALSGTDKKYRTEDGFFVRWGLVESDLRDVVVKSLTSEKKVSIPLSRKQRACPFNYTLGG